MRVHGVKVQGLLGVVVVLGSMVNYRFAVEGRWCLRISLIS